MKKIIIIGAGGHARSCCDVIELEKKYKVLGFIDNKYPKIKAFNGYPVLGNDSILRKIKKKCQNAFVAIGHVKTNKLRKEIFKKLYKFKFSTPKIISPKAYVSNRSKILDGTIVMHDAIINAGTIIMKNCIINSKSLVEHDCIINNNCHIAPGAIINGHNVIGEDTFIGSGTIIKQGLKIKNGTFINANRFVSKT